ncbi:MAG: hypothetical protein U1E38_04085 [Rhodospirillales bacterium]
MPARLLLAAACRSRNPALGAPISKFSGVDDVVFACTTSTTFVNIPGLSRSFTLGAGAAEEVVAMLQGSFSLTREGSDTAFVRLLIDNVVQGPGDQVPIKALDDTGSTHGFNWQSKALSPGAHTVRVQWRTDLGSQLCADARSLIILHK